MIKSIDSPFQAPAAPGVMCVIVDTSFDPQLPLLIEHNTDYGVQRAIALFSDTPFAALQAVGPVAVLCTTADGLTDQLSTLLAETDAGCVAYLENADAFDEAVMHWRSLLTVSTDASPTQLMRFFDPRWLEPLLNSLDEHERWRFLGPVNDLIWRNELGWRRHTNPLAPTSEIQEPGWLHFGTQRLNLMRQHNIKILAAYFAQYYHSVLPMPQAETFVHEQLLAAYQVGYRQEAHLERWLRLELRQGDSFWSRAPFSQVLKRTDLSLDQKLVRLESF